jgi:hypothetical protein
MHASPQRAHHASDSARSGDASGQGKNTPRGATSCRGPFRSGRPDDGLRPTVAGATDAPARARRERLQAFPPPPGAEKARPPDRLARSAQSSRRGPRTRSRAGARPDTRTARVGTTFPIMGIFESTPRFIAETRRAGNRRTLFVNGCNKIGKPSTR